MTIPPQDYDVVLRMAKAKKVRRQRDSGKAHFRLSACVRKMALPDLRAAPESLIRAVLPPLLPIRPPLLSIFDAGLVADAGREKRASRSGCKDEQERSCDPLSGNRREGVFHTT